MAKTGLHGDPRNPIKSAMSLPIGAALLPTFRRANRSTVTWPARNRTGAMADEIEAVVTVDVVLIQLPNSITAAGNRVSEETSMNLMSLRVGKIFPPLFSHACALFETFHTHVFHCGSEDSRFVAQGRCLQPCAEQKV